MFIKHPAFVDPQNQKLKLWRYVKQNRLFDLLESSCLYFCRADYFQNDDSFEGSYPRLEYEYQLKNDSGNEVTRRLYEIVSKDTFINCWHLSEHENLAMWELYAKDGKGIAIQTDIINFKNAFNHTDEKIFAGKIDYIDYETDTFYSESSNNYYSMNSLSLFLHKRKIYDYEKEYRAICYNPNGSKYTGLNIKIDLNNLIQKICLSPFSTEKEEIDIKNKLTHLSLNFSICLSSFKDRPYY